jgi:hypothetical protein
MTRATFMRTAPRRRLVLPTPYPVAVEGVAAGSRLSNTRCCSHAASASPWRLDIARRLHGLDRARVRDPSLPAERC